MTNLWDKKPIRSVYDPTTGGYWFSVVDVCAAITDSEHNTASGYWKRIKRKKTQFQVVTESHHLKLKAPNGKYHFTEVIDFKSLIRLVQTCPSPKANIFRLWLADMLFAGVPAAELEQEIAKHGSQAAAGKEPGIRLVAKKEKLV